METNLTLNIQPFPIPFGVEALPFEKAPFEGVEERLIVPMWQLPPETLEMLCSEFRFEVFKLANKPIQPLKVFHQHAALRALDVIKEAYQEDTVKDNSRSGIRNALCTIDHYLHL